MQDLSNTLFITDALNVYRIDCKDVNGNYHLTRLAYYTRSGIVKTNRDDFQRTSWTEAILLYSLQISKPCPLTLVNDIRR